MLKISSNRNLFLIVILCCMAINVKSHAKYKGLELGGDIVLKGLNIGAALYTLSKSDKEGLKQFLYTSVITAASVEALKHIVKERRPSPYCSLGSFPSGHVASSFAPAVYMWKRYGSKYGIPMTLAAGFVGYTRVEARKHHVHDVLAGAILGAAVSYFVTTKYDNVDMQLSSNGVSLNFTF